MARSAIKSAKHKKYMANSETHTDGFRTSRLFLVLLPTVGYGGLRTENMKSNAAVKLYNRDENTKRGV